MTKTQQTFIIPALGALMLVGGAIAGYTGLAAAQTTDTATTTTQPQTAQPQARGASDPSQGGHVGANGTKEEILTGDVAAKVTAAALAAQPGATIQRVETDAEGAAYEAHMTSSDGSHITLKFDSNFAVTATEDGPGPR
jgi:hypothetical protein